MKRGRLARAGIGMVMVFILMAIVVPALLMIQKNLMYQSRASVKDKNIKSARQYAGTYLVDVLRTFASDFNRDHLAPELLGRLDLSWANQGGATAAMLPDETRKTLVLNSRGWFRRHATSPSSANKGINSVFHFRSDLTRFEMLWDTLTGAPGSFDLGAEVDPVVAGAGLQGKSIWVNGDLDTTGSNATLSNGVLVVNGDFTAANVTLGPNLLVYCKNYILNAPTVTSNFPITVLSYPATSPQGGVPPTERNNPLLPRIDITNPGADGRLDYYANPRIPIKDPPTEFAWYHEYAGAPTVTVQLFPAAGGLAQITDGASVINLTLLGRSTLAIRGANLVVSGTLDRQLTLVALGGGGSNGDITVMGDVLYHTAPTNQAGPTQSLAVLAAGSIFFNNPAPAPQSVVGFYYSLPGTIHVLNNVTALTVHGSLFGRITTWPPIPGNLLTVNADPQLYPHYPPNLPKRPYVATWDYVP